MGSYCPGLEESKHLASNLYYELGTRTRKGMGLGVYLSVTSVYQI